MAAAMMHPSVLAVAVAAVVDPDLVRILWLNSPPPKFGYRN
jgi:hypothetical protein